MIIMHILHLHCHTHIYVCVCVYIYIFTVQLLQSLQALLWQYLWTYLLILSYEFYYILIWHLCYVTHLLSWSVDSFYILRLVW